ncbi:site-specific tyrosine recombinase XerD [Saccharicrinis sp. FJH62]|uniref:site-specific tyrosine recombinase XerD n=1 Tax=Saccharicrinis sp. FJH62 TaxID=3344657 RepID=UPI0035D406B7
MKEELILRNFKMYLRLEKSLSENSVMAYMADLQKLTLFCEDANLLPSKLSYKDLSLFIESLADLGISPRTQARIISGIKSFYKFLVLEKVIDDNPTALIEGPRTGRKLPDVLSLDEIDSMIAAIDLSKPEGQRNKAILETLYGCGLRVSELINLKISEIYFDEMFIRVIGKGDKQRLVPINKRALNEIMLYLRTDRVHLDIEKGHEDFVFLNRRGKQLTRVMIFTIIKNLAEMAGIHKTVSPHTFRHSFATDLLENGANLRVIQEMLGHSSILTTEIYTHLNKETLKSTIEEFHPRK